MSVPFPRASREAVAVACVCLVLLVLDAGVVSRSAVGATVLACGVLSLGAVAPTLAAYRAGRAWTAGAAGVAVAVASLLTTALVRQTVGQRTPGWAELLGLLVLLCLACRYGRRGPLAVSAVALFVAVLHLKDRAPTSAELPLLGGVDQLFPLLAVGFALFGGYLRTEDAGRRATAERVRRAERLDLARDLHDHVAHHVTAVVVQAQAGEQVVARDPETARRLFTDIEKAGQEGLVAMGRMVRLLRDADDRAAAPAVPVMTRIAELVHRFPGPGQHAWLDVADGLDGAAWSPQLARSVERVVQEGLTNVRKHARTATAVHVTLGTDGDRLIVRVRDDASGQPRGRGRFRQSGFGLIGLTERVGELGGELTGAPLPEGGWELAASLPMT
ncbi:sensor histidine kinase [Streptomyces catenulae]|uniref:histidine kinase n=1 Tax=Streptomyces catenulae TaxID=66875 RepID=A0ABV2YSN2_9ACTN|nr:histidine kinase [Streptomyces catenulae]